MFSCKAENAYNWCNSNFSDIREMRGIHSNSGRQRFVVTGVHFSGKQWENQVPISDFFFLVIDTLIVYENNLD